jgi:integrase/recombinase XerD
MCPQRARRIPKWVSGSAEDYPPGRCPRRLPCAILIRAQRVTTVSGGESWTVVGEALLPIPEIEEFLAYCTAVGKSPRTVETYAYALATLFRFLDERHIDWREVTLEQAARFVEWLQRPATEVIVLLPLVGGQARGRQPATVNKITAAMTSFYDYHAANGVAVVERIVRWRNIARRRYKPFLHHVTKGQPVRRSRLRVRQPEMLPKTLSPGEVQQLLDACARRRDRFLLALLYDTGLRIGQALGLRHEDFRSWELSVVVRPRNDNANRARAKTHKEHVIAITAELVELHSAYMFEEYGDLDSDYVFVNLWGGRRGQAMTYATVDALFARLRRRTGVGVTPHMLRHTHATELLRFGVQTDIVARRLTHAGTSSIHIYEHLDQADLRTSLEPFWAARAAAVKSS